jgi:Arc/MetJ-type ribon-helix-helix transcriptional regulator
MPTELKVITVKLPKSDLVRIPRGRSRSEFIRVAVSEKLDRLEKPAWKPKTPLGRALVRLRKKNIASGGELLDAQGIAAELRARRGGQS